jgi:cell wall-associated NlpC family hydrolase
MGQYAATQRISKGDLRPGDLVFFNAHHVGMYIGGGQIIHAATPALGVRLDSLASAIAYNGYLGAGRI